MICFSCPGRPAFLAGPFPPTGDRAAPVFLLAQNPPQRLSTARPGAFRLHVPRESPPGRLEKAVDALLAPLGGPGIAYASQAFKCATVGNRVDPEMVRRCRPYLAREVRESSARLFLALGRVAGEALFRETLRRAERGSVELPVRGGVPQRYTARLWEVRLRTGRDAHLLELPHPATATRFILPGAWERGALPLARRVLGGADSSSSSIADPSLNL